MSRTQSRGVLQLGLQGVTPTWCRRHVSSKADAMLNSREALWHMFLMDRDIYRSHHAWWHLLHMSHGVLSSVPGGGLRMPSISASLADGRRWRPCFARCQGLAPTGVCAFDLASPSSLVVCDVMHYCYATCMHCWALVCKHTCLWRCSLY